MILVEDILEDVAEALGVSADAPQHAFIFRRLNRAVELLASKGDWDPLLDVVDVCVQGSSVALPSFVHTPLAVSVDDVPLIGRDRFFEFHPNGPGRIDAGSFGLRWNTTGAFPCQYEIGETPGRLVAISESEDDEASIRVYGFDKNGLKLTTTVNGVTSDGIDVPIYPGYLAASEDLPEVEIITRVRKPVTVGRVRLYVDRGTAETSEVIARYEYNETAPQFVRIDLGLEASTSARVFFRHRTAKIVATTSEIRLHNPMAVINAVKAIRYYLADDPEQGQNYEQVATRMLQEQEMVQQPPNVMPISVPAGMGVFDPSDSMD